MACSRVNFAFSFTFFLNKTQLSYSVSSQVPSHSKVSNFMQGCSLGSGVGVVVMPPQPSPSGSKMNTLNDKTFIFCTQKSL
jgi:hypothetical protein